MAESIAIYFKDTQWRELIPAISLLALQVTKDHWSYPKTEEESTLTIYEYDSWIEECEEVEKKQLVKVFGYLPTICLCLELRRSRQRQACEDVLMICKTLLSRFEGIVDDCLGTFWTLNEIKSAENFLEVYKVTPKQVETMQKLWDSKEHSLQEVGDMFGVSKWTVKNWVK